MNVFIVLDYSIPVLLNISTFWMIETLMDSNDILRRK